MTKFGWHKDRIARATPVTPSYRNIQSETMGDAADEWLRIKKK
jgi:hypothetical protein